MSDVFLQQLGLGEPDYFLGIGGGSNNEVVGKIIIEVERVLSEYKPDMLIVPGDVNSTFACAFAAASLRIPVAHIESGLRSMDMDMPEERNRILTDRLSDLLFVTEQVGIDHLVREGVATTKIKLVGNTIVDALIEMKPLIDQSTVLEDNQITAPYCLMTFHRPVNVDSHEQLQVITDIVTEVAKRMTVVFPIHPRTLKNLELFGLKAALDIPAVRIIPPQGYIEFIRLMKESTIVISDSGGIQIETSCFGVPCFTVRDTTELKITIEKGTNQLVPLDASVVTERVDAILAAPKQARETLMEWDGQATERIVSEIAKFLA
jgi:UDP-N-acetylglucosamine 2-epimerase (non-hydrolysing)